MKKTDPWFQKNVSSEQVAKQVEKSVRQLYDKQGHIYERNLHHLRLYSNRAASGLYGRNFASSIRDDRLRLNVIKAVADTAMAHIATNKTYAQALTKDGDFLLRRKYENLTKFGLGMFNSTRQHETGLEVFLDACIFGTGVEKIYPDYKRGTICAERVIPDELAVDDTEAKYGPRYVRQMFHHKHYSKTTAMDMWPEHKAMLEMSGDMRENDEPTDYADSLIEPVSVVEAYYLPSSPSANDGRHSIVCTGGTLVDERWDWYCFPFAQFRWSWPGSGFWGIGLAEELSSIQIEINYLLQKIQKLMTLATTQIWVDANSVAKQKLSNKDMGIVEMSPGARQPIFQAVQSVSGEYFQHLDRLYTRAFEIAGVSQLSATSKKPAGLDSGEALRTYNAIGSQRFMHVGQRFDQFHCDAFELMAYAAKELDEYMRGEGKTYKVLSVNRAGAEEIEWPEIDLDKDKFFVQVYPSNLLPEEPAGQIQTLQALAQIDPQLQTSLARNLNYPDVKAVVKRLSAKKDLVDKYIDDIIEHGKYRPPHSFLDLEYAVTASALATAKAELEKVPEDRLDKLRSFSLEVAKMLEKLAVPPPPQGMTMGPPGQTAMGAPPVDQAIPPGIMQ
jgi:hypothetical protein